MSTDDIIIVCWLLWRTHTHTFYDWHPFSCLCYFITESEFQIYHNSFYWMVPECLLYFCGNKKKNESVERIVVWCTAVEQMSWLNWQYQLDIIRGYCSNGNQNEKVLGPHFQSTWCVWIYVGWRVQARAYVIHVIYYAISNKYNRKVKKKVFLQENCSRRRIFTSTQTHFPNILRIVWSIGHHVKCSFFIVGHY